MPISAANMLSKVSSSKTFLQKQMSTGGSQGTNSVPFTVEGNNGQNRNFSENRPPEMFFKKDKDGKIRGYILNFVPTDELKENGENGLWTGKLYEWNMTGDTMLVVDYLKSKLVKQSLMQVVQTDSIHNNGTSFLPSKAGSFSNNIKVSSLKPGGVVSQSIWEWLGNLVSDVWQAINYIGYHLGIPGAWIPDPDGYYKYLIRTWDFSGSNHQQAVDYIAGGEEVYGLYFTGGGGGGSSYQIPAVTDFDKLIMLLRINNYAQQQFLVGRPDIQQAIQAYLDLNGETALNIEFTRWAVGYLNENPNENVDALFQNGTSIYYTDAEMEGMINTMADPITGNGVELYLILKYRNSKIFETSRFSKAVNNVVAGDYTLTPHYDGTGNLMFYAAGRLGLGNFKNGIEYIIRADQLSSFTSNVGYYTSAADLVYMNGIPDKGMIQMMAGDRWTGLHSLWSDAVKSPVWWAYVITSFGHAIIMLPNASVGSTVTTQGWKQSMKKMTADVFQGKTVTNPQGAKVTINIPDNYVVSITDNGKGLNFRPSVPINPGYPGAGLIRIMEPNAQNPKGYVVFHNVTSQPYNPNINKTLSRADWHFGF